MDGNSLCPISPVILQEVENLPPSTNLDFDLGTSEFFMTQLSSANESQVRMKRCVTSCEMDDTTNKKQLRLSLWKNPKPIQERFSSVTCEEIKKAQKESAKYIPRIAMSGLSKTFSRYCTISFELTYFTAHKSTSVLYGKKHGKYLYLENYSTHKHRTSISM